MASKNGEFVIRRAKPEDAPQIAGHRRQIFAELGDYDPAALEAMRDRYCAWIEKAIKTGEYRGWFAVDENQEIVAGAGLWVRPWPISPRNLTGKDGHVLDLYVHPAYRGRGLGRELLETILAWCEEQNLVTVSLEATDAGKSLYQSLGFEPLNILRKRLV